MLLMPNNGTDYYRYLLTVFDPGLILMEIILFDSV